MAETTRGSARIDIYNLLNQSAEVTQGAGATPTYRQIGPVYHNIGPHLEDLVIHAELENKTTNFKYRVAGEYSYDGVNWQSFSSDVLTEQTSNGYVVGAAFNTRTDLGMHVRFKLGLADTGSQEQGDLSISVAFKYWSS